MPALATARRAWRALDARWFQILFLASLLVFGALRLDFALRPAQLALTLIAAVATQAAWQWGLRLPTRAQWGGYLSALVSSLGIAILVRADNAWVHPLVACVAMSSKYLLRAGPPGSKTHVFNPANLAAFMAWGVLPGAWLSPGQWGTGTLAALWFIGLGGIVTGRIQRWDVSLAFMGAWGALLALRLAWLGYAWNPGAGMWVQQVSGGSVLLFAFFMISDPMTTPQRRGPRMAYACAVALAAWAWQFCLYRPHGLIVALFALSAVVPWLNHRWPRARFEWRAAAPQRV